MRSKLFWIVVTAFLLAVAGRAPAGPVDVAGRPLIEKQGTIGVDLVETTPIVFGGTLYRLQWEGRKKPSTSYFDFVNAATGEKTAPFGRGCQFCSAYVENGTVYVTGTPTSRNVVKMWTSTDLRNWTDTAALSLAGWSMYNTSICKANGKYVMSLEIDKPTSEAGKPFTARFATSPDLKTWALTSSRCVFAKDRYTAPHCLRYGKGYYYLFYLEDFGSASTSRYQTYVVRSKDLIGWEASPLNPVLSASADDRQIAKGARFTADELHRIATAKDINNSDIDFCECGGRLAICYSWGNQKGVEHLASAIYRGSEAEFLEGWFPHH
jgi:hypothetical protein